MTDAPPKRRRQLARKWHRWLGLVAAFPVLWLAISGVLLNHAQTLGLNDRMVTSGWVLRHYNQLPEGIPGQIKIGDRRVYQWGEEIILDQTPLLLAGELVAADAFQGQLLIVTSQEIAVLDGSDDLLLELDELSLPATPIEAMEVIEGRVYLLAAGQTYVLSEDFFSADRASDSISPISLQELTPSEKRDLSTAIQTRRAMPLARVILDAHSGSLFGWPGWVVTDLAAVGLVILTLLGLRLFPKRRS